MPEGNLVSRSFRIKPGTDFLPYIVAGRYQEQVVRTHQGAVSFWTFQTLDAQQARAAAARLSASMRAFADFFGPSAKGKRALHVVEAPGDLPNEFEELSSAPGGTSFPEGVLLDSRAFTRGLADENVLQLSEYELARTWFGWRVRPRPEAQILMGRGVGLFSLVLAAEAQGQDQRGRMVASLLARYDQARQVAEDRTLLEPPAGYSREERISTGYRAALFFVALEDLCGHEAMRTAFRNIIRAREEDDVDLDDVRAAMEFATGGDLAEMFHQWLSRSSVPEDFRARYTNLDFSQIVVPHSQHMKK
jgi:aminopeptidase N